MKTQTKQMDTGPGTIEMDDIVCFESQDNPGTWLYIPGVPQAERVNGRPSLQLYSSRDSAILQLGAQWTLSPEQLAGLRNKIAMEQKSGSPDFHLQPAPVTVKACTIEFGGEKGERMAVASAKSSGMPPHTALFRVVLTNEGRMLVTAALHGREGMLLVRYRATANVKIAARAELSGDIDRAAQSLSSSSSPAEIRNWIDQAIQARLLRLEFSGESESSLLAEAVSNAKDQFAQALQSRLSASEPARSHSSTLRIEAFSTGFREREFDREADVSKWFPAGNGQDFITVV